MKKLAILILMLCIFDAAFAQKIKKIRITQLADYIQQSKGPLIVTFWATFCTPCCKEIPYFQTQAAKDTVELLLVSLDLPDYYPAKIDNFATKQKFTAPIAWLNETNADLFCPLIDKKWSGAIPASLFVNNATGYRKFVEGQVTEGKLKLVIGEMKKEKVIRN